MQLLIETERTARLAAEGRTGWIRIIIICLASYSSRNVLAFKGFFFEHAMFNKGCDVPPPPPRAGGSGATPVHPTSFFLLIRAPVSAALTIPGIYKFLNFRILYIF